MNGCWPSAHQVHELRAAPTAQDLLADNLRRHVGELRRACPAPASPVATTRHTRGSWLAIRELAAVEPAPA
jgi:hypothetical protein